LTYKEIDEQINTHGYDEKYVVFHDYIKKKLKS